MATRVRRWVATQPALAVTVLVGVNVAVFVAGLVAGGNAVGRSRDWLHRDWSLFGPAVAAGEWWRLFSSGFVHYGAMHLGFNMLALWQLGGQLERMWGSLRFIALYVASLLAGSAVVLVLARFDIQAGSHGGASGAVFGLLGALAMVLRSRGISLSQSGLGATLLINIVLTFSLGLSIGGHLGGFIGGALVALGYAKAATRKFEPRQLMVPGAVAVASVVIGLLAAG